MQMGGRLAGKRALVTMAQSYMGPAIRQLFEREGATVYPDETELLDGPAARSLVEKAGQVDILVANLSPTINHAHRAHDMPDESWSNVFETMVHPLHHLCKAVLPQMYERRSGKIVVVGSIAGLRSVPGISAYCTARTAQVGFVRSVAVEAARHNVQINLIAQHFVEHDFFSKEFQQTERFRRMIARQPLGRLATAEEDAKLALFLAGPDSDFIVGEAIPFTGGWHL